MKATEQYFPVVLFIMLHKVVLTFTSVDETPKCDHSNDRIWAVLSCGTVYCGVQGDCNLKCDHSNKSWAVFPLVFFIMLCQFAVVSVKKQKIVFVQFVSMLLKISYLKICLVWLQNYGKSFCFQICHYSILFNSISYTYVNYHLCLLFQCSYQWFYRR